MKWIGLTGGIASGKSTVAKILRDMGIPVLDADHFSRVAVAKNSEGYKKVVQAFGPEILNDSGELHRENLAKKVFSDERLLRKLEGIVHPIVQKLKAEEKIRLEQEGHAIAFYDVPLLFEKNLQEDFDATLLVYCSPENQRIRMAERDHLSESEIEKRISNQMPIDEKVKLATYTILNENSPAELKSNVERVLADILKI
jgi:dephospho-CoA kinase